MNALEMWCSDWSWAATVGLISAEDGLPGAGRIALLADGTGSAATVAIRVAGGAETTVVASACRTVSGWARRHSAKAGQVQPTWVAAARGGREGRVCLFRWS
jgi:hypothetical protein